MRKLWIGIVALTLGCSSDNLGPLGHDYYALESVAGTPLPAPYAPNLDYNGLVLGDSIAFRDDGTGIRRSVFQEEGATEKWSSETDFTWIRNGNQITISLSCPPFALCIAGPHLAGTIDDETLTISESTIMRHPALYRRSGIERLESRRRR